MQRKRQRQRQRGVGWSGVEWSSGRGGEVGEWGRDR